MRQFLTYIAFLCCVFTTHAQNIERPKLVVGIVIDQMRWDYLYKYYSHYGDNGFKKLMNEGFNCQNANINYLPTFTGPGHAAIYTGSVPAIHGIAANDWVENTSGKFVYCVEDEFVASVGGKKGRMSPIHLKTSTITDELRIATNRKAKVFGIGIKDRGSILPAGHVANGAFWFDDATGNFITSGYYMKELPGWLQTFNNKKLPAKYIKQDWVLVDPISHYTFSKDDNPFFEGTFKHEDAPIFPHKAPKEYKNYNWLRYVPWGNSLTIQAANACILGEGLGKDAITDFLCVTLSTTDYAGHKYGPDALEMEDVYVRLDMEIAEFLKGLDEQVGKGNYTIFLTADHGAAHNAEYMRKLRVPSGSIAMKLINKSLYEYVKRETGKDSLIHAVYNYQVYFNKQKLKKHKIGEEELKTLVSDWLYKNPGVANVVDMEDWDDAMLPEPIKTMIVNGYYRERCGQLQIIMEPAWYSGYGKTGTTHGSWNPYDAHIPLLWYGWGIAKGETYRNVKMTDIAPTVAALLHIQAPNGCIGEVITEVLK